MSLLPALFQNIDPMPMALGAKIVAPVPKKPDPIAAFEKGVHTPDGKVHLGVDKGQGTDFTVFSALYVKELTDIRARAWMKGDWGFSRGGLMDQARATVEAAVARGVDRQRLRDVLRRSGALTVNALADSELPRFIREVAALTTSPLPAPAPTNEDLHQNEVAAKMALIQRQKQELRALARKDYKR